MKIVGINEHVLFKEPLKIEKLWGEREYGNYLKYVDEQFGLSIKQNINLKMAVKHIFGFIFLGDSNTYADAILQVALFSKNGYEGRKIFDVILSAQEKEKICNTFKETETEIHEVLSSTVVH